MKIAELRAAGVSVRQIAARLGIAYGTTQDYAKGARRRPGLVTSCPGRRLAVRSERRG